MFQVRGICIHHTVFPCFRQAKRKNPGFFPGKVQTSPGKWALLSVEGLAVGALVHGGVCLVGAYQDPVQGAVVLGGAVVGALADGTLNALVCMAVHGQYLHKKFGKDRCSGLFTGSMTETDPIIPENTGNNIFVSIFRIRN